MGRWIWLLVLIRSWLSWIILLDGSPKFLKACDLPLTGSDVTDLLITNLAVFEFKDGQPVLIELAPGVDPEEIKEKTEAEYTVCPKLKRHLHIQ